jgi:hypothetical protein
MAQTTVKPANDVIEIVTDPALEAYKRYVRGHPEDLAVYQRETEKRRDEIKEAARETISRRAARLF